MPRLKRIIETAVYVDDLDRARQFYGEVLELDEMLETKSLIAYDVSKISVLLVFKRGASARTQVLPGGTIPPHDGSGLLHICFAIDAEDLADWETRLREHNIAIESRMMWERGGTSIYFRDPDGHLLELMTPGNWPIY